ncbi:MAG: hypothetical protein MPJ24_07025 [Pirellulaceae bacterium]|nr:hypothetical protein [Pirellulaceae bacterium]
MDDTSWYDQFRKRLADSKEKNQSLVAAQNEKFRLAHQAIQQLTQQLFQLLKQKEESTVEQLDRLKPQQTYLDEQLDFLAELCNKLATSSSPGTCSRSESSPTEDEFFKILEENERLKKEIEERSNGQTEKIDGQDYKDLQDRFEMAVQDIRELKTKNNDLKEQLDSTNTPPGKGHYEDSDSLNWESQKQRLLCQLESDFDDENPEELQEKINLEGTIRMTDLVVAKKDQEIQELKLLIENQSNSIGEVAIGAAAFAEMFDNDEIIQEEREKSRALQKELQEKLRQAEIDISLQKAKLAREGTALEDKLLEISEKEKQSSQSSDEATPQKNRTSRWLSQIGLSRKDK